MCRDTFIYRLVEKERGSIMSKKKKCSLFAAALMLSFALCGCGGQYPELNEDQEQAIIKYAAALLQEHNQNRTTRLMSEEEMVVQMLRQEAHSMTPTPTPTPAQGEKPSSGAASNDPNGSGEETFIQDTRTMAEFFGLSGIDISCQGCFFTKSYPEAGDGIYFAMDASEGNEFLIVQYVITNHNADEAEVDILNLKPKFRISINGGSQINALSTLLLDDLKTTNCTIAPGESHSAVVVFEVAQDTALSLEKLTLTVRMDGDSWTTQLESGAGTESF